MITATFKTYDAYNTLHLLHVLYVSALSVAFLVVMGCIMQSLFSQRDDDDGHMTKEMTEQLNFGGGFLRKKADSAGADEAEDPERHRTKKEVSCCCQPASAECVKASIVTCQLLGCILC